jgi:hypothetical protein
MARRGGFILPIVLIVISLLAVTMASFVFFVRAEVHGTTAHADAQQALLAAESGLNEVIATLRLEPLFRGGRPRPRSQWSRQQEHAFRHYARIRQAELEHG